jgi:two-component system nitrogen regulation response regulator GlnG
LSDTTLATFSEGTTGAAVAGDDRAPSLTILWHPDTRRVGEVARLPLIDSERPYLMSREQLVFHAPGSSHGRPLASRWMSRRALRFESDGAAGVVVTPDGDALQCFADGVEIGAEARFGPQRLERGVVLLAGTRIALLLHLRGPERLGEEPDLGLCGESDAMGALRSTILKAAATRKPVLLRGESGTGKELVAQALHAHSDRATREMVSLNLAAVTPTLAASELFGHERGGFSGAVEANLGVFRQADGSTLFLDEIGDAAHDVQVAILRAVETGEVRPIGRSAALKVDVRFVAATDVDLDGAVVKGEFKSALIERVAGIELHMTPLRQRRDDIARLLLLFLKTTLAEGDTSHLLTTDDGDEVWLPATIVADLVRYDWPRNVRQLRNLADEICVLSGEIPFAPSAKLKDILAKVAAETSSQRAGDKAPAESDRPSGRLGTEKYRSTESVSEHELRQQLRAHQFRVKPAAEALGLSQQSMYRLMEDHGVLFAKQLDRAAFERHLAEAGGDLDAMSERLGVSKRGLQLRRKDLGLK